METLHEIYTYLSDYLYARGPSLLLAVVVLLVGMFLIRRFAIFLERAILKRSVEASLASFLSSFSRFVLVTLLLITVASMLGIATTSFVAALGAVGLTIGLALQKSLSNFAGGMIILFFKPFKVGEYISVEGMEGIVEQIDILNTTLCTSSNQMLVMPNGTLANTRVINYSRKAEIRSCIVIGISYDADIDKARAIILDTLLDDSQVLTIPVPKIWVKSINNNTVYLSVYYWTAAAGCQEVESRLTVKIKRVLDNHKVAITLPRQ